MSCALGGVIACAAMAAPSFGAITPTGRLSSLYADALCGGGPVVVLWNDTVTENGVLASGPVNHNHTTHHNDQDWGESKSTITMTQDVQFTDNLPAGLQIDVDFSQNKIENELIRPIWTGASATANGTTDSVFTYKFTVDVPTAWSLEMDAHRNPTGWFACTLTRTDAPGAVFLSPVGAPYTDADSGVLDPGDYEFFMRQDTFLVGPGSDESLMTARLILGEVPAPGVMTLAGVGAIGAMRRRR